MLPRAWKAVGTLRLLGMLGSLFAADRLFGQLRAGQIANKFAAAEAAKGLAAIHAREESHLLVEEAELHRKLDELEHEIVALQGNRLRIVEDHHALAQKTSATNQNKGVTENSPPSNSFKMNKVLQPPFCTPKPNGPKPLPMFIFVVSVDAASPNVGASIYTPRLPHRRHVKK